MLFPPGVKCSACDETFNSGDRVKIIETGTIEPIGGLGLYKDSLTLRNVTKVIIHDGTCPRDRPAKPYDGNRRRRSK